MQLDAAGPSQPAKRVPAALFMRIEHRLARDLVSFGGGTIVVMAIAIAASLFPAWRASKTDPLKALRHQ